MKDNDMLQFTMVPVEFTSDPIFRNLTLVGKSVARCLLEELQKEDNVPIDPGYVRVRFGLGKGASNKAILDGIRQSTPLFERAWTVGRNAIGPFQVSEDFVSACKQTTRFDRERDERDVEKRDEDARASSDPPTPPDVPDSFDEIEHFFRTELCCSERNAAEVEGRGLVEQLQHLGTTLYDVGGWSAKLRQQQRDAKPGFDARAYVRSRALRFRSVDDAFPAGVPEPIGDDGLTAADRELLRSADLLGEAEG